MEKIKLLKFFLLPIKLAFPAGILYLFMYFVQGFLPAVETIVLGRFLDNLLSEKVYLLAAIYIICIVLKWIIPVIQSRMEISIKNKLRRYVGNIYFDKKNRLAYSMIENKETQDLWMRISEKDDAFFDGFTDMMSIVEILVQIVSSCCVMALYSTKIASITLIAALFTIIINNKFSKKRHKVLVKNSYEKRFITYLSNMMSDREYSKERFLFEYGKKCNVAYEQRYEAMLKKEVDIELFRCLSIKTGGIISVLFFIGITFVMIKSLSQNVLSIGMFIAICQRLISMFDLLSNQTSQAIYALFNDMLYYKDVHSFLTLEEEIREVDEKVIKISEIKTIQFVNVSFAYPGTKKKILNDLSFTLHRGEKYAIVGENGSGKTTIVKLLCGLYTNYTGEILINGIPVQEIDKGSLISLMAVGFQDFLCYDMSIDENVRLEKNGEEKEHLYKILRNVGLFTKVIKLPQKENTHIGKLYKDGIDFSGGEKQKIVLARCLYKNAQINILDEPTSAIDPKFESKFIEILRKIPECSISLIISHRLGCTKKVDKIFVLKNGTIIEAGNFHELYEKKGEYYEIYEKQSKWYKTKDE